MATMSASARTTFVRTHSDLTNLMNEGEIGANKAWLGEYNPDSIKESGTLS